MVDSRGRMISGSGGARSRKSLRRDSRRESPALDNKRLTNDDCSYWLFLAYFVTILTVIHLSPISYSQAYISLLGYIGLAVEATLPLPQIFANHRSGSCKGFRLSLLAAWILGDAMKMSFFFFSAEPIPWAFKMCGMFQCVCDSYLGFQYWMFTRGSRRAAGSYSEKEGRWGQGEKDIRMN